MNRKPNPKIIGAFVTATLLLFVCLVMYFGSSSLLKRSTQFILFFDQSVNGLAVGSPVKFRGVPVGKVEKIMIRAEGQAADSTAIPVLIEIDRSRLENDLGVSSSAFQPDSIHESIERGLVAQLSIESFITGQLFVEFSFEPDKKGTAREHLEQVNGTLEIPTLNSSLDQITADIAKLIADVGKLDLQELSDNVNKLLVNALAMLDGIDSEGMSASVIGAADELTLFIQSEEFASSLASMKEAFNSISATADSYNLKDGPLGQSIDAWTAKISATLEGFDRLSSEATDMLKPDSDVRFEFEKMLRELGQAARSVRILSQYLERNPNSILTGRSEEEE